MEGLERFFYPECADASFVPSWNGWAEEPDAYAPSEPETENERPNAAEFDLRLAEEAKRSFDAGRAQGVREGREAERSAQSAACVAAEQKRIQEVAKLVAGFDQQRYRYFHAAEQEVVMLALAVAGKVLRREAQTDTLLLMGAVRTALGQVAASTEVRFSFHQRNTIYGQKPSHCCRTSEPSRRWLRAKGCRLVIA